MSSLSNIFGTTSANKRKELDIKNICLTGDKTNFRTVGKGSGAGEDILKTLAYIASTNGKSFDAMEASIKVYQFAKNDDGVFRQMVNLSGYSDSFADSIISTSFLELSSIVLDKKIPEDIAAVLVAIVTLEQQTKDYAKYFLGRVLTSEVGLSVMDVIYNGYSKHLTVIGNTPMEEYTIDTVLALGKDLVRFECKL